MADYAVGGNQKCIGRGAFCRGLNSPIRRRSGACHNDIRSGRVWSGLATLMQIELYTGDSSAGAYGEDLPAGDGDEAAELFLGDDWWRVYRRWFCHTEKQNLRLFLFRDHPLGHVRAMLPLNLRNGVLRGCANYYSPIYGLFFCQSRATEVRCLGEFSDYISRQCNDAFAVRVQPMDPASAAYGTLRTALRRDQWSVREFFCFGNWFLPNNYASYRDYINSRPAALKNTIKRRSKRLFAEGGEVCILESPEGVAGSFGEFERIYRNSWKPRESHPGFVRDLAETMAERGATRLGLLCVKGTVAAAQLWFVSGGVAYIYKLAHDEAFERYSPGTVLTAEMFRRVIDHEGVDEIDFLMGDDAYKSLWMSHRRERWGIKAYNSRCVRGRVGAGLEILKYRGRKLIDWQS